MNGIKKRIFQTIIIETKMISSRVYDPRLNNLRLKVWEVSDELAKCFDEDQKNILEFTQGDMKITLRDQIDRHYGNMYLVYNLQVTKKMFADMIYEKSYLIDEIGISGELIKELKKPDNFRLTRDSSSNNVVTGQNKAEAKMESINTNIGESSMAHDMANASRTYTSDPTHLIEEKSMGEDKLSIELSTYKYEYADKKGTDIVKTEIKPPTEKSVLSGSLFHNQQFLKTGEKSTNSQTTKYDSRVDGSNTTTGCNIATGVNFSHSDLFVKSENILKSLKTEVPRLRSRFWLIFSSLFTNSLPCLTPFKI